MSKGEKVTLTRTKLNAMKQGEELWDTDINGLLVRAGARGRSFLYSYTNFHGQRRKLGIGIVSLEKAREKAGKWRDLVADGKDPASVIEEERQKGPPPTLKDLEQRWEMEAVKSEKFWQEAKTDSEKALRGKKRRAFAFMKPKTIEQYRRNWKLIFDNLGERKALTSIAYSDISKLHQDLSARQAGKVRIGGPIVANRVINFLATVMQSAILWGLIDEEAESRLRVMFSKIDRNQERRRQRFLKPEELPKFYAALERFRNSWAGMGKDGGPNPKSQRQRRATAYLIDLLLAQGTRVDEMMSAKLTWIDWSGPTKILRLPESKTGAKDIPLGDDTVALLKKRAEQWFAAGAKEDEAWIVPSPNDPRKRLISPYKGWRNFLDFAELSRDLTPHTLRHTIITVAVNNTGASLKQAGAIVGHASEAATSIYTHHDDTAAAQTLNKTNAVIKSMMTAKSQEMPLDDNIPAYMKTERENLRKLQEAAPAVHH